MRYDDKVNFNWKFKTMTDIGGRDFYTTVESELLVGTMPHSSHVNFCITLCKRRCNNGQIILIPYK